MRVTFLLRLTFAAFILLFISCTTHFSSYSISPAISDFFQSQICSDKACLKHKPEGLYGSLNQSKYTSKKCDNSQYYRAQYSNTWFFILNKRYNVRTLIMKAQLNCVRNCYTRAAYQSIF